MIEESGTAQLASDKAKYGSSRQDLEDKGERSVSDDLDSGTYGDQRLAPARFVSAWLADKAFARQEESFSLSKAAAAAATSAAVSASEANTIARSSRRVSINAAIIAAIAAIAAIVAAYAAIKGIR